MKFFIAVLMALLFIYYYCIILSYMLDEYTHKKQLLLNLIPFYGLIVSIMSHWRKLQ